jgi:hypothetical protein
MMSEKIITGLKSLDVKTDAQWTQDGQVNLNAFKFVNGGEAVTREQLEEIAPGFNRETAATYFDEKKEGEQNTAPAPIEGGTVTDANVANILESANATSEEGKTTHTASLRIGVDVTLSDAVKTLIGVSGRQDFDVKDLDDERLAYIIKSVPERRNQLINLREEFNAVLEKEFNILISLEEEAARRVPVENHADLVKRIHEANAASKFIVDQPRQRVAQPIPPLKK